jgi:VanZ family protein
MKNMFPPLGLMAMIFILSSIPGRPEAGGVKFLVEIDPQLQNLLHIPLFGTLQILWLHAFKKYGLSNRKIIPISLFITLAYGCLDELHQMFVPGRYASLTDILLNLTGIMIGTLIFIVWKNKKKNQAVDKCS